jgi:hypothetical protein
MAIGFVDNGGAVIEIVRLQLIYWGSAWGSNPPPTPTSTAITNNVTTLLSSGYMTGLAQYRDIGLGYLLGSVVVTSSDPPNSFTDNNVSTFVAGLISSGVVPNLDTDNQTLYCVIMPQGISASNSGFIGEHTYYTDGSNRRVHFAWVTNNGTLSGITQILSHELVESCTDPEGSAILGTPGTCSGSGWCEIGDVCESTDGVVSGVAVQSYWSQQDKACKVFDFPPRAYPITGVQFTGTLQANQTQRWFTFNWLAYEQIIWTVMPTTVNTAAPQLTWTVQVQRASGAYVTYWISVTNLTNVPVAFEGRYCILGR